MIKFFACSVIFFSFLVFFGCQQEEPQKNTMQKETSTVSITVKDPNEQASSQTTEQEVPKPSSGGAVGVVE